MLDQRILHWSTLQPSCSTTFTWRFCPDKTSGKTSTRLHSWPISLNCPVRTNQSLTGSRLFRMAVHPPFCLAAEGVWRQLGRYINLLFLPEVLASKRDTLTQRWFNVGSASLWQSGWRGRVAILFLPHIAENHKVVIRHHQVNTGRITKSLYAITTWITGESPSHYTLSPRE